MNLSDRLEVLATNPLPPPFDAHCRALTETLQKMRADASAYGVTRLFTLDGRLLGDVGELIAKVAFGVQLHCTQNEGQDGVCCVSGRTVEVKLRSRANLVWVKAIPDILVTFYLSPHTFRWGVVCNGPGNELLRTAKWSEKHGRYETTLAKLLAAQTSLTSNAPKLALVA